MDDQGLAMLKQTCRDFFAATGDILSWQWDSRFEMALAQFSVDDAQQIKKTIEKYLSLTWNSSNVDQSPEAAQAVVDSLGGLLPGQLLFTSASEEIFLLCAWWPWNNGKTISVRFTYHGTKITDDEGEELTSLIQSQVM